MWYVLYESIRDRGSKFESAFTPELINVNLTYKFQYHQSCKLSIEMLDTETDGQNSDDEKEDTARKYAS